MKQFLRKIARSCGFDIHRLDRFGADPSRDLRRILEGHPVTTVFDVGANDGQSAVEFAKLFPEASIHSFEPLKETFDLLTKTTQSFKQIKPVNVALWDAPETRKMFVNKYSPTNSLLPNAPDAQAFVPEDQMTAVSSAMIQVETIDGYCAAKHIAFVDLLKLDAQGYEQRILLGGEGMLAGGKVAAVFAEVLFAPLYEGQAYFHEIYGELWKHGFRLTSIYSPAVNSGHYISWCDALFIHPETLRRRLGQ
jgi:FkbM family methyltransferase